MNKDKNIIYIPSCWFENTEENNTEWKTPVTGTYEITYIGQGGTSEKEPEIE